MYFLPIQAQLKDSFLRRVGLIFACFALPKSFLDSLSLFLIGYPSFHWFLRRIVGSQFLPEVTTQEPEPSGGNNINAGNNNNTVAAAAANQGNINSSNNGVEAAAQALGKREPGDGG